MSNNDSNKSFNLNAVEFIPKNSTTKNREDKTKKYNNRNKSNNNNNYNRNNNTGNNSNRHGGYNNKSKNSNNRRQNKNQYQQLSSNQSFEIDGPRNKRGEVELTHLVNFTFPPRQNNNHNVHYRKKKVSYEPFSKQRFINSNYQFILKSDKTYEKHLNDPDAFIEWDNIQQVIIPTSEIPLCPICLNKPIVGKVTNCGHCFCYPCILHYLKVDTKEKYKSCPLCQEIVTERSLKYVRFREVEKIKADQNKRVEFKLMKRKMGTSLVVPKTVQINNILKMPKPNQIDLLPFAKLFYASSSYIKNEIILPAYRDLQEYLHEVELEEQAARLSNIIIVSEIPYIQMAINKVVEESKVFPDLNIESALKLLSKEEKKEIFKDSYASKIKSRSQSQTDIEIETYSSSTKSESKKSEIKQWGKQMNLEEKNYQEKMLKKGGFEPAFSDNEEDDINNDKNGNRNTNNNDNNKKKFIKKNSSDDFDGQFILNNNNFYQSFDDNILNEAIDDNKKDSDNSDNDNEDEDENKNYTNDEDNDNDCDNKKEKGKKESSFHQTVHSDNDNADSIYYFYQLADGQHYYLHPLCNKILKYEYGDYVHFPDTISCRILYLEESTINEDMRKRFKYLSHLPLTCDIVLCEIYLSDIVSSATFKKFKSEITQLSKKRQQKMAKEAKNSSKNKENNLKDEWMNLYKSIESSSTRDNNNKSQPLLYEPVYSNSNQLSNKKKNDNNSQESFPAALSQEAIDFLKNEQKKKAANSFAKIASSSSSNVTFSPWKGNTSTPRKKNLMVDGNEWVVSKNSGWSLDFDELVDDSEEESHKQKELTISDIINNTKNKSKSNNNNKGKGKSKSKNEVLIEKGEDEDEKNNLQTVIDSNKDNEEIMKKEEISITESSSTITTKNNEKLGKKKSKKVIMISNGGQRRRY
ncbi:hypothetical protein BCR32DRAFT_294068 [Anaeromyces robustus]|uniref:RING-type domain-containing protein n=1 Tax=Anaeromyces robustus TaxID=1754192 RepID=A0A1Y1X2N1_9FUNG|nr:hypothetical protein BCR32DRAFT_294068 [Anaeromyces robustus]|eukprot:ORX80033.1 hypothetical protein BCR32DRAFT_294068 [Anaeromyces robustus]